MNYARLLAVVLIAAGLLVLDNRRCRAHIVASVGLVSAGLLFML